MKFSVKKIFFIFLFFVLIFGWYFYNKYMKEFDTKVCETYSSDYVMEFSDQLDLVSTNEKISIGNNVYELKDWVVALEGRTFLCFSSLSVNGLKNEIETDKLPNFGIKGMTISRELVNFESVGWESIRFDPDTTIACLQISHKDKLVKGARFVELSIYSQVDYEVGDIHWLSEGFWTTKCKN